MVSVATGGGGRAASAPVHNDALVDYGRDAASPRNILEAESIANAAVPWPLAQCARRIGLVTFFLAFCLRFHPPPHLPPPARRYRVNLDYSATTVRLRLTRG